MALTDAEYKCIYVDVGAFGRESDGGVFARSSLSKRLSEGALPPSEPLGTSKEHVPYCIVADNAFPIKPYIMKPFPMCDMTMAQRIFNYRLSRSRRIIKNVFGICSARFRVLLKPMELKPEKVNKVVLAVCALHNFLITRKSMYTTCADFDRENENGTITEGNWRAEIQEEALLPLQPLQHPGWIPDDARAVRTQFMNYFMGEGEVPWQYQAVGAGNF